MTPMGMYLRISACAGILQTSAGSRESLLCFTGKGPAMEAKSLPQRISDMQLHTCQWH